MLSHSLDPHSPVDTVMLHVNISIILMSYTGTPHHDVGDDPLTWITSPTPDVHVRRQPRQKRTLRQSAICSCRQLLFLNDSVSRHWIFICMVQAITGHSGALAGRSISYYSMKLTLSLQTTILLSGEEGGGMVALREKKNKTCMEKRGIKG